MEVRPEQVPSHLQCAFHHFRVNIPDPDFQTELAINTHVAVSDTRAIVSELGGSVTSTHVMVSDIHRTIVQGQEGNDGKHLSVSDTRTLVTTE